MSINNVMQVVMKQIKLGDIVYNRLNYDEIISQLKKFGTMFDNCQSAEQFADIHKQYCQLLSEITTNNTLVFIRNCQDVTDEYYAKEREYLDNIMPEIELLVSQVNKHYTTSPFVKQLSHIIPPVVVTNLQLDLQSHSPKILEERKQNNKLSTMYSNLISQIVVDYDGQKMPLSQMGTYLVDGDRNVRRSAMIAYGKALGSCGAELDDIFDKMVKVRTQMAKKLGYENFVPLGYLDMQRNCYDSKDIERFRQNILRYIVPLCQKIYQKTQKQLGIDKQYLYDENIFGDVAVRPLESTEQIMANASAMYNHMDKEMGALFDKMVECQSFDCLVRPNKCGGGFCVGLPQYKLPFIFSNFNGSQDDIETLTHEFGHAYNAYVGFENDSMLLSYCGMETAEVHSMSMEFLTYPYMDKFFGDNQQQFKYNHLAGALVFLPYGTMVDYFQQLCYEHYNMTSKDRLDLYLQLEHRFRPWASMEGIPAIEQGRYWQRQSHIYENPFYYIDYCLAQITALQFLAISREEGNQVALDKYKRFVSYGNKLPFVDIIKECGLLSPFEESTFVKICSVVTKILQL